MCCHFLLQRIFLTQGSNPCLLNWQADSLPLWHLGSYHFLVVGNNVAMTTGMRMSLPGTVCISFGHVPQVGLLDHVVKWSEVTQSCPTLCDPMDCSLPGSSVHGIFQARILEWVAISFSRRSSWPRDRTRFSHIVGNHFIIWATREALGSYGSDS